MTRVSRGRPAQGSEAGERETKHGSSRSVGRRRGESGTGRWSWRSPPRPPAMVGADVIPHHCGFRPVCRPNRPHGTGGGGRAGPHKVTNCHGPPGARTEPVRGDRSWTTTPSSGRVTAATAGRLSRRNLDRARTLGRRGCRRSTSGRAAELPTVTNWSGAGRALSGARVQGSGDEGHTPQGLPGERMPDPPPGGFPAARTPSPEPPGPAGFHGRAHEQGGPRTSATTGAPSTTHVSGEGASVRRPAQRRKTETSSLPVTGAQTGRDHRARAGPCSGCGGAASWPPAPAAPAESPPSAGSRLPTCRAHPWRPGRCPPGLGPGGASPSDDAPGMTEAGGSSGGSRRRAGAWTVTS
jgi:hypothetical protein